MGKINVLDFEIANLIAAGEVVERPSSVLKELIENSIDAGATKIVAEIKRGGVALIRVTDDGVGMEREDLPVAIKRHATSKIQGREDLDSIATLGFRGEALAAIGSVCALTIITKTKEAPIGSMLTAEAGQIVDIAEVGAADGTTVVVENLFYNVPARRKFLKKDATEAMNVTALVEKVALSRPDISIQLLIDGEERFKTPGDGKILSAVRAVFGKTYAEKTIPVDATAGGIRVHGLIGQSDNVRKNRNYENVFINNRYVKSLTATAALERAYTSYIAPECFPACVLFLDMHPASVDVNVHPAKLEVKFADERAVFEAVYHTVRRALEENEYRPEMRIGRVEKNPVGAFVPVGEDTRAEQLRMPSGVRGDASMRESRGIGSHDAGSIYAERIRESLRTKDTPRFDTERGTPALSVAQTPCPVRETPTLTPRESISLLERYRESEGAVSSNSTNLNEKERKTEAETNVSAENTTNIAVQTIPEYRYVGEAFDCYVMVEFDGDLLIIDKHAAHERVIFEDLKAARQSDGRVASQALLLPIDLALTPDEHSAAREYREDLLSVGFTFELTSRGVAITAIPTAISAIDAEGLFVQMTDELASGFGNPAVTESVRRERALYQVACKSAIKGGRVYDRAVIDWLIGKVLSLPDITVCPHGRPICYKLTRRELDRQFDRIK